MAYETSVQFADPLAHRADFLAVIVQDGAVVLDKEGDAPPKLDHALLGKLDAALGGVLLRAAGEEEFTGKDLTSVLLHTHGKLPAARLAVMGIGRKKDADKDRDQLRVAAARAVRLARSAGAKVLAIALPEQTDGAELARDVTALAEGAQLGAYKFDQYLKEKKPLKLLQLQLLVPEAMRDARLSEAAAFGVRLAEATCLARTLVNEPAGVMTPQALVKAAEEVAARAGLLIEVHDRAGIEKLGMRLFLAVAQGSVLPPLLVKLSYVPKGFQLKMGPKGDSRSTALALVGKALTFDSGGLSIKTAAGMEEMKTDMAGAAAVIAAMEVIALLKPDFPVHAYFGACENMPSGQATRPGDVIIGKSGTSVEILNTDAEGRLVLADVLAWACEEKPAAVIDLATLTGACIVALGTLISGLFSNEDALSAELMGASKAAGEELWRLPLPPQMEELIKSPIADLKNTGGRFGGAINAALFLQHFVGRTPWAHLDIAGPSTVDRERGVHPRGATGVGVRTLVELVRRRMVAG